MLPAEDWGKKRPQTWDSGDEQDHAHAHSSSSKSIFATCPLSAFKSGLFLKLHHLFSFQFGNPSISHQPLQEPPLTSPACVRLRQWCLSCHALSLISVGLSLDSFIFHSSSWLALVGSNSWIVQVKPSFCFER